jgi:hypothetical protein
MASDSQQVIAVASVAVAALVFTLKWFIGQLQQARDADRETIGRLIKINVDQATELKAIGHELAAIRETLAAKPKRRRT